MNILRVWEWRCHVFNYFLISYYSQLILICSTKERFSVAFFFLLQLSNSRDVAVVTAGGLFSSQTQWEDADALPLLASFKTVLFWECSVLLS